MTMTALAPLDKSRTLRAGNLRNGRNEIWDAATADGVWQMEREEGSLGTPWALYHVPTERRVMYFGTLRACRRAIASGAAWRMLEDCLRRDSELTLADAFPATIVWARESELLLGWLRQSGLLE